ncbi:MAG: sigma-54-dependent Fis family transcriptional regulator, partial [Spirochaetales bacterium]|nr:sigma-54-dependent Fis family transcriptional regulator [Spirochaetales bacterium]
RVLQEREFERVGDTKPIKVDIRVIATTNREIKAAIKEGVFREDLYYRLNVVTIHLPPLRERNGDIGLLIQFFLKKYTGQMNRRIRGIEAQAMRTLTRYHWPGNIRELENTMERAVLLSEGDMITSEDLNLFFAHESTLDEEERLKLPNAGIRLEDAERDLILQALERCGWVQKDAARLLGVSSRALNYKIKRFGFTHPSWKQNR